jgi:hypothetical protein
MCEITRHGMAGEKHGNGIGATWHVWISLDTLIHRCVCVCVHVCVSDFCRPSVADKFAKGYTVHDVAHRLHQSFPFFRILKWFYGFMRLKYTSFHLGP